MTLVHKQNKDFIRMASWNVNGIRSVYQKGFSRWLDDTNADIICLQETKAHEGQLPPELNTPTGYRSFWHSALKKGYSGVVTFCKHPPLQVLKGIDDPQIDAEGRVLTLEFDSFYLINAYFPNSQREHGRLKFKCDFCDKILAFAEKLRDSGKEIILCGDFNIAHQPIDLKNPKSNANNAGFLPEERACFDALLKKNYIDCFRLFNQNPEHYTWWSYRPGVREKNIGWRLDYFCASNTLRDRIIGTYHQPQVMGSDHCPVILELRT